MIDVIVEIRCISPGWNKEHHRCIWLLALLITLLHPGTNFTPIRWIAEHFCPPQFCFRPSISGVKNLSHLAFSGIAQGSRLNPNSSFSLSKKSCGVAHTSFSEENNTLFIITSHVLRYTFTIIVLTGTAFRTENSNTRLVRARCHIFPTYAVRIMPGVVTEDLHYLPGLLALYSLVALAMLSCLSRSLAIMSMSITVSPSM